MKRLIKFLILSQILSSDLPSENTALIQKNGQKKIGLFSPLIFAKTNKKEYSIHPILGFVIPNLKIKSKIHLIKNIENAYSLKLTYPTPLLKIIQKDGIGGLITPNTNEVNIPHILVSELGIYSTKNIINEMYLSIYNGIAFTFSNNNIDDRITIDIPYIFPRMNMYNSKFNLISSFNISSFIMSGVGINTKNTLRITSKDKYDIAFEHKFQIFWYFKSNMKLIFGYNLYFAEYPFGNQWSMFPMIDLNYHW